jgi:membrane protein implicated in regulation of membrane protease activity
MTETTRKKKLRWGGSPRRLPAHPYRDSAIVYGILAAVVIGVTALTGGNLRTALILAPLLFVVATGYSWWRLRQREREDEQHREEEGRSQ